MNLGERVHLLRRRRGWTQRELAQAATINANSLARIERSEIPDPGGKAIARLALALRTSTDYLLGLTETEAVPRAMRPAFRQPGLWQGKVWISPDFDNTDEELIRAFEGGGSA